MKFWNSIFLSKRLFQGLFALVIIFVFGFVYPLFFIIGQLALIVFIAFVVVDFILVYSVKNGVVGSRNLSERFSLGDENEVLLKLSSRYKFPIEAIVYDEIPLNFQIRDFKWKVNLSSGSSQQYQYYLTPKSRGEETFGVMNVLVTSPLKLVRKRYKFSDGQVIKVYPSIVQLRKYEFMAIHNRLSEIGVKQIRKIGQSTEFDQIREYVRGDDYRTINWKATARRGHFMVNQYQDEKSQQVYCVIDKGRAMKMPFHGLTLLDYAINSALVLSNIALKKGDKAGLITFSNKMGTILKAENKHLQIAKILEVLYNQQTRFYESDFGRLYNNVKKTVKNRSMLLLFTNFESLTSLHRQLPYLRSLSKEHLLVVVFFENEEMLARSKEYGDTQDAIYTQAMFEKFVHEKRLIVKELNKFGINALLTTPEKLTINVINKYVEVKSKGVL